MKKFLFILHICCFFCVYNLLAQNTIQGTVYDNFTKRPLEAVTVQTSSGGLAITDSSGKFKMPIVKQDSIWFTYLSKRTQKYPVDTVKDLSNFEVALYVDAKWLPAVKVRNRSYRLDSLQNRQEYAKVFNFKKPGLSISSGSTANYVPGGATAGINLDELINMFRFRRKRQMLSMQERLIMEEQDKYVNHRFTKYLVQKLTPLTGPALDSFMNICKPSYELLQAMNDIELGYYIQQSYEIYSNQITRKNLQPYKKEEQ